jgi:hypothetical protein
VTLLVIVAFCVVWNGIFWALREYMDAEVASAFWLAKFVARMEAADRRRSARFRRRLGELRRWASVA